ncbi:LAFA_0D11210g1_1 [Lachancea sp. 'fantastica']|nr:LAFA_0D11210g1_1 [Lachancea sp. 'fantastica']
MTLYLRQRNCIIPVSCKVRKFGKPGPPMTQSCARARWLALHNPKRVTVCPDPVVPCSDKGSSQKNVLGLLFRESHIPYLNTCMLASLLGRRISRSVSVLFFPSFLPSILSFFSLHIVLYEAHPFFNIYNGANGERLRSSSNNTFTPKSSGLPLVWTSLELSQIQEDHNRSSTSSLFS